MPVPTKSGNVPTVDGKGRVLLPKELRERLGIDPGTSVTVRAEDGRVVVDPEDDPEAILDRMERLVASAASDRDPDGELAPLARDHARTVRDGADRADE